MEHIEFVLNVDELLHVLASVDDCRVMASKHAPDGIHHETVFTPSVMDQYVKGPTGDAAIGM